MSKAKLGAKLSDIYVNWAGTTITESAANTLTFEQINTGFNPGDNTAWIITKTEYTLADSSGTGLLVGNGDAIKMGISRSNQLTDLSHTELVDARLLDYVEWKQLTNAAGEHQFQLPLLKDHTNLPGGGILVHPAKLYACIKGLSLAGAATGAIRIYYITIPLDDKVYRDLFEASYIID